ncbi:hypothetical protein B0H19DRAFT_1055595 [Mycena capillaripes]|nr:hypothetical protein B0H19DRAFT_1055595 [Mycena capillaripes]
MSTSETSVDLQKSERCDLQLHYVFPRCGLDSGSSSRPANAAQEDEDEDDEIPELEGCDDEDPSCPSCPMVMLLPAKHRIYIAGQLSKFPIRQIMISRTHHRFDLRIERRLGEWVVSMPSAKEQSPKMLIAAIPFNATKGVLRPKWETKCQIAQD